MTIMHADNATVCGLPSPYLPLKRRNGPHCLARADPGGRTANARYATRRCKSPRSGYRHCSTACLQKGMTGSTMRSPPPSRRPDSDRRRALALFLCEAGERGFETIDRERLRKDRPVAPTGAWLTDETARRDEERDRPRRKGLCYRIARQTGFEINVDDRGVEFAFRDMPERRSDIARVADDTVPQRLQRIFEHHGDKGIIFDDQYPLGHIFPVNSFEAPVARLRTFDCPGHSGDRRCCVAPTRPYLRLSFRIILIHVNP